MPTLMWKERVKDYSAWRSIYDGHVGRRAEFRCTGARVYRNADDENDLLVMADFPDETHARLFVGAVRKVQEAAGVNMSTVSFRILPPD